MFGTLKLVSSLMSGIAFLMLGSGALTTILSFRMGEAGYSSTIVGAVSAMYFVGLVMGTGFAHRLISGVGHIRTFTALGSLMSAATLAHAVTADPYVWGVLRFVVGFCMVGMVMCTESWLAEKSSNEIRGQVFSIYQVVLYLAQGAAQFLIAVPDDSGLLLYILTSVLMSLSIIPVALTRVVAPDLPEPQRFNVAKLWKASPTGMTSSFASGLIMGAFYGVGALFAQQAGLDKAGTSLFMGSVIIGGLVLQYPIGKLSDRIDRRRVMLAVTVGTAIVCALLMNKSAANGNGLTALAALFGGLAFTIYPLAVAYTNDFLKPEELVPASGGLIIAYGIGAAAGPVAGAAAMDLMGAGGLFIAIGTMAFLLAIFIIVRMTQRETIAVEDQGDFQPLQRTSQVVYEMHPEAEPFDEETEEAVKQPPS